MERETVLAGSSQLCGRDDRVGLWLSGWLGSLLLGLVMVLACSLAAGSAGAAVSVSDAPRLAIITTADLQSHIYARKQGSGGEAVTVGGMDRIASLARSVRSQVDGALLLSSGDDLMGFFYSLFGGQPEIESMNMAGYDVVAPGNQEFDFGIEYYAKAAALADFPILSANLNFSGSSLVDIVRPAVFRDVAGIRVGIFGLMNPALQSMSAVGDGVRVDQDPVAVAKRMVWWLRQRGAQMVVALSHCGTAWDRRIGREVCGIDLIVGGHSHQYIYETVNNPLDQPCILVQAGAGGKKVGVLRFNYAGRIVDPQWQLVELDESVGSVPAIKEYVDGYVSEMEQRLGEAIGSSEVALDGRREVVRSRESNLGDLVADAVADWFATDEGDPPLVMISSGSLRGDRVFPAGPLSYRDVLTILPFGNTIVKTRMQGEQLLAVLEASASALGGAEVDCPLDERVESGGFLQLSRAFRVVIDPAAASFCARYEGRKVVAIINPGERIKSCEIRQQDGTWQALDPKAEYTVYVNSWVAVGGDGHYVFLDLENEDTTDLVADLLASYIKHYSPIKPEVDGRLICNPE